HRIHPHPSHSRVYDMCVSKDRTADPYMINKAIAVDRKTAYVESNCIAGIDVTLQPMNGDLLTWEQFEQAAPEIAKNGRELIERFQFILVGTLTKDGSPRVTPVEAYIIDGHLL